MTDRPIVPPKRQPSKPAAWPYRADPPQRYWVNYGRYLQRGGLVDLEEDIQGFVAGGNVGDIARFYFFCLAFDQIKKEGLAGDLAELGVYRGHTASLIARMARRLGRTAFLLDTFEGFSPADLRGIDVHQKMQFADTSIEAVRTAVGEENVQFVKGHFPGTANELPDTSYCLVHIDCDLYAPILSALEYFYPRLVPGGYLIVHDYSSLAWDGAERAVDEFLSDKPESLIALPDGAGSIAIRKARDPVTQPGWLLQKRVRLFSEEWVSAGEGRLTEILGKGWSPPESWGVWGVGNSHEMKLWLAAPLSGDIALEAEVSAPLIGAFRSQVVDVLVEGQRLATWRFTEAENRAVRRVRIPQGIVPKIPSPSVRLEFRPHEAVRPADVDPTNNDTRDLGMSLRRIRRTNSVE